mgnify:FL=1
MCGVAVHGKVVKNIISDLRLVFFAVAGTPVIARNAMNTMEGLSVNEDSINSIQNALEDDLDTFDDLQCSAKLRMHYAKVLTKRVLNSLVKF